MAKTVKDTSVPVALKLKELASKEQLEKAIKLVREKTHYYDEKVARYIMQSPRNPKNKYERIRIAGLESAPWRNLLTVLNYLNEVLYPVIKEPEVIDQPVSAQELLERE